MKIAITLLLISLLLIGAGAVYLVKTQQEPEKTQQEKVDCFYKLYSIYYALQPEEKQSWSYFEKYLFVKAYEKNVREICNING